MLGSLRTNTDWAWAAFGKHPSARDFIRLGPELPIFNAFCNWVERGFLLMRRGDKQSLNSWRFWARGTKRSHLVCGLLRDSHDSIGRPYPCLIIGTGLLSDWEDHWDQLPAVLEKTWGAMEYLFVKRLNTINDLSDDLSRLQPACIAFSERRAFENDDHRDKRADLNYAELGTLKQGVLHHVIKDDHPFTDAARWLKGLSSGNIPVPNAVFLGGVPQRSSIVAYNRSLQPTDFAELWSGNSFSEN